MSIKRFNDGYYTPACDVCGKQLRGDFYSSDAIDLMRSKGWAKDCLKMEDICDDCQEEDQ